MKTNIRRIKQSYWIGKAIWGEKKWVDLVRIHKEMRENSRSSTYRLIQNFLVCHFLCMGVDMLHILGTLAEKQRIFLRITGFNYCIITSFARWQRSTT